MPGETADTPPDLVGRRRGDRRRLRDHAMSRVRVADRFAGGWLAFESPSERRRLAPIPPGWEMATDGELLAMCVRARAPAVKPRASA